MLAFRGEVDTKLAVFCEDATASAWLQGILRFANRSDELSAIEWHAVGSHGDVAAVVRAHNRNPAKRFAALGFVDGDTPADAPLGDEVFRLPGTWMPEEVILDGIREGFATNLGVLTVGLLRRPDEQEWVRRVIETELRATEDMHLIFNKIGQRLGFLPEETVRLAMIAAWCQTCPNEAHAVADVICQRLPLNGHVGIAEAH
jgi:hypothetical protein